MTDFSRPRTMVLALLLAVACRNDNAPSAPPGGNQPPDVVITSPLPGSTVQAGTPVILAGRATDPEDGVVPGGTLSWESSRDGTLGQGDSLVTSALTVGAHTISLQATDDSGATATVSITLSVTSSVPVLGLDTVATGLSQPVFLTAPPGDLARLFVVEKTGTIRIIKNGKVVPTPFLDISGRVSTGSEQGLLGLAFAPDYAASGRFYVSYTSPAGSQSGGTSVIARYLVSTNPDRARGGSAEVILTVDQPFNNHNGGMIAFGPDGALYAGFGDGGSGGDPLDNGQDRTDLLGSLVRLDVSGNGPGYAIPPDNPYAGHATFREELWNWGLRNPWRWSFDRNTGDLYIADVGQGLHEEVDVVSAGSTGGENYGWNIMEGLSCYNAPTCNQAGLTLPVLDYDHGQGCSVTGGYVYRGSAVPSLAGHYLYADYCGGWVRSFRWVGGVAADQQDRPALEPGGSITSFGEDARGEVYILTQGGLVTRVALR